MFAAAMERTATSVVTLAAAVTAGAVGDTGATATVERACVALDNAVAWAKAAI